MCYMFLTCLTVERFFSQCILINKGSPEHSLGSTPLLHRELLGSFFQAILCL